MRKILSIVLSAVMLISCFSFAVFAEEATVIDGVFLSSHDYAINAPGKYVINDNLVIPEDKTLYLGSGVNVDVFGSVNVSGKVISRGGSLVAKAAYKMNEWTFGRIINPDNLIGDGFEAEIVFDGFQPEFIDESHYIAKAKYCCSENGSDYEDLKYFYINCTDDDYITCCNKIEELENKLYTLQFTLDTLNKKITSLYKAAEEVQIYRSNGYNSQGSITKLFSSFPILNELKIEYLWPDPSDDYELSQVYNDLNLEIGQANEDKAELPGQIEAVNKSLADYKLQKQQTESRLISEADISSWPNDIWQNLNKTTRAAVTATGEYAKVLSLPLNQYFFFRLKMEDQDGMERYDSTVMRFAFNGVSVDKAQGSFKLYVATAGKIEYTGAEGTSEWDDVSKKYVYDTGWNDSICEAYTKKYNVYLDKGAGYRVYGINGEVTGAAETVRLTHGKDFTFRVDIDKEYSESVCSVYFVNNYQWNDDRYAFSLDEMAWSDDQNIVGSEKSKALFGNASDGEESSSNLSAIKFIPGKAGENKLCYIDEYGIYHVSEEIVKGPFSICVTGVIKNETISLFGRLIEMLKNIYTTFEAIIQSFFKTIVNSFSGSNG